MTSERRIRTAPEFGAGLGDAGFAEAGASAALINFFHGFRAAVNAAGVNRVAFVDWGGGELIDRSAPGGCRWLLTDGWGSGLLLATPEFFEPTGHCRFVLGSFLPGTGHIRIPHWGAVALRDLRFQFPAFLRLELLGRLIGEPDFFGKKRGRGRFIETGGRFRARLSQGAAARGDLDGFASRLGQGRFSGFHRPFGRGARRDKAQNATRHKPTHREPPQSPHPDFKTGSLEKKKGLGNLIQEVRVREGGSIAQAAENVEREKTTPARSASFEVALVA